ncbi:MAG TPA: sigma-70 family RNA polymerase sigma factor [Crocinitomicaceae bacterium]|nr:sigma-70 family RNA polymerase sigma factor [Crocinitomicaceae bacterium]
MEEKELIKRVLDGNSHEFGYFVNAYQRMALTIAFRICENRQEAEDIVQNAFVKAYHNLHTFHVKSKFSTWFYRIVYNLAVNASKKTLFQSSFVDVKNTELENVAFQDSSVLDKLQHTEISNAVHEVLGTLPKDLGLILSLYYIEENSINDIAEILGITKENVKIRLFRGRKLFIQKWEQLNVLNN